jgi:eukaryotic-like serine/threonine-protein kinase
MNGSANDDDDDAPSQVGASDLNSPDPVGVVRPASGTSEGAGDASFDSLLRHAIEGFDQPPSPHLPRAGDIVGEKYRIEEQLGRGGMGVVFRATHLISDKPVAIKWMLRSSSDEHARRRFVREARVAGRIDHPNVVDVYDIGQQGEQAYLVMELLRGEALRERLLRGRLGIAEAVDLLLPAMHGVSAVHQAGVVHRDLKPDNIFMCEGRQAAQREAKVLDFGISAMAACDANDPTLTWQGAVLGTPAYMSPEQLHDSGDIDARTDVYSFGVILYEALTGALPFAAESHNGLVLAIANSEPKAPTELRPDLPSELGRIVLRALAKQREDRYPNIESLIEALLPYASQQEGESGERISAGHRRLLPARKLWLWGGSALLAAGALAWWHFGRAAVAVEPKPNASAIGLSARAEQPAASVTSTSIAVAPATAVAAPKNGESQTAQANSAVSSSSAESALRTTTSTTREPSAPPRRSASRTPPQPKAAQTSEASKARSGSISLDEL